MDNAAAGFLDAAYLAESTASELTAAAEYLDRRGNTAVARALLRKAKRHSALATQLRAQGPQRSRATMGSQ